jgi:drug/metabolite transporter (DMT)-like permease
VWGIALVIAAVACFATLDTTTKVVSVSVPQLMGLWFRYFFQAVATTAVVLPLRGWRSLRTAHPKFQLLRGLLLLTSSLFAFLSLKYMPWPNSRRWLVSFRWPSHCWPLRRWVKAFHGCAGL